MGVGFTMLRLGVAEIGFGVNQRKPSDDRWKGKPGPRHGFSGNDPVAQYDAIGLSPNDVSTIYAVFIPTFDEMCKKCLRCDAKALNNLYALSPFSSNLGCTSQALFIQTRLLAINRKTWEDTWIFDTDYRRFPPHNWGTAHSRNASDPEIALDTWRGCITMTWPNGRTWEKCLECAPAPRSGPPGRGSSPVWPNDPL